MTDRIDFEQVREAVRIATESDITELEVETPSLKIRVRKAGSAARGVIPLAIASGKAPGGAPSEDHLVPIIAPMVGTFYRAGSPEGSPFVKEGDVVGEGQVVCMIEAMKLFNEIQAEVRGRIARVLLDNASPVEYGQPLFLVDPAAGHA